MDERKNDLTADTTGKTEQITADGQKPGKTKKERLPKQKLPKEKPPKQKRKFTLKLFLIAIFSLAVLIFAAYQIYNLVHFRLYRGYEKFLSDYTVPAAGTVNFNDSANDVPGMRMVSESAYLRLYTDTQTAAVAIYDKRNGEIIYSNPPDADNDPNATPLNKSYLKSQLIVEHYSAKRTLGTYNTYDHAVSLGQFEYAGIENGIRYTYTLGDFTSPTGIVPVYISQERFDELTTQMSDGGRYFRARYIPWDEREGYLELPESAQRAGQLRRFTELLGEVGYTEDDFINDMLDAGAEDAIPMSYTISLDYQLYDDHLDVSVPARLIQEDGGAMVSRIQLLRYFGAAGMDEDGYMLLPNGAGSIVYFNNGKQSAANYSQFVYGIDPLLAEYVVTEETQKTRLPVYGIARENSGVFVSLEESESLASVTAYVSGAMNSYNFAYPTYILRGGERLTMFGSTDLSAELPIVEADYYDVNYRTRYYFLTEEHKGYPGMANFYRDKLEQDGRLVKRAETDTNIPFYMDLVGGVMGTDFFLGSQYFRTIPMTTFEDALIISNELRGRGVSNQVINYQGWFNRGFYHDVPDKVKVINKLGGKNGLSALTDTIENRNGKVYGDVVFQNVTFASRRFNWQLESSRYYGAGYVANFGAVHPVMNMQTSSMGYVELLYDCLSPKFLNRYVDDFAGRITDINITGIGLRDLGDALHSDKRRTEIINRHQAQNIVTAQFDTLSGTGKDIMVAGGNLYALGYASDLIDVPMSHNAFFMIDEQVPFYQMVVHGYINYTGEPINLNSTADTIDIALNLLEMSASPRYAFTYESSSLLKQTALNRYHATTFDNWREQAIEVYSLVNGTLSQVTGYPITDHKILQRGVTRTTYGNGISITVNKNDYPVIVDGAQLDAKDWSIKHE